MFPENQVSVLKYLKRHQERFQKEASRIANDSAIIVHGARVHNLKNLSTEIPRNTLTVMTGPSGSGKSSLAFDTLYAEGQRRYVESLSVYARQFLDQLEKPDVESISGLSPTISIEQRTTSFNPRSTVGTVTEIYDFLRLLFARVAKPYCYNCGEPIQSQSPQQIVDQIVSYPENTKLALLAPIIRERKGEYQRALNELRQKGFVRVRIDEETYDLSDEIPLDRNKKHNLDVYIDRLILRGDRSLLASRVSESVDLALKMGSGQLVLLVQSDTETTERLFSEKFACQNCKISYPKPEPKSFSFNSPMGACPKCEGLGTLGTLEDLPLFEPDEAQPAFAQTLPACPTCHGTRLRKESLSFKLGDKNIIDLCDLNITELSKHLSQFPFTKREQMIAERIIREILERLEFLTRVGVTYLTLSRSAQTLSGGEAQRIRLASQLGSSLVGVIYVLDEPSIGLHPRDHDKLLDVLKDLRDRGNTVIVVEHDRDTIEKADWILDLGPGAGTHGGEIVASGSPETLKSQAKSLTGQYLKDPFKIALPAQRRQATPERSLKLESIQLNNLKNLTVEFPLGVLTCVTGVSGSGKSTLVLDVLYRVLFESLYHYKDKFDFLGSAQGIKNIDKVIDIDQSPIGKTPRSNPATYTGLFSLIRDLFGSLPESKIRGYKPGRFSFNVEGGRCEKCQGAGLIKVEMHFLPNTYVKCEACKGSRYHRDTLSIRYKGKSIADVLEMTAEQAVDFFSAVPALQHKLQLFNEVGLGYLRLGQQATTLSGGEAQRIKLTKELSRRSTGATVYILDEPTTGLHLDDILKLIRILQRLVEQGNTVIVIEHNLDLIKVADYIIDLGPEGGEAGGLIIAQGTPEQIAKVPQSHTGRYLKPLLKKQSL